MAFCCLNFQLLSRGGFPSDIVQSDAGTADRIRAFLRTRYLGKEKVMLAELSIIPVGGDSHSSAELAKVLKLIEKSGLPYQLTPSATCIEGEWDQIMPLIRQCHEARAQRLGSYRDVHQT